MKVAAGSFPLCMFFFNLAKSCVIVFLFRSLIECPLSYSAVLPTVHIGVALQHVSVPSDLGSCHLSCHKQLLVFDVERL